MLKPTDNGHGYKIIQLYLNKKRVSKYVHRLVAEAFIENPDNKPHVNHLDYNRANNRADNLEWCTAKENTNYSAKNMRKPKNVCAASTGEKYIYYRKNHDYYRVIVGNKEHIVKTLEEAIALRDKLIKKVM